MVNQTKLSEIIKGHIAGTHKIYSLNLANGSNIHFERANKDSVVLNGTDFSWRETEGGGHGQEMIIECNTEDVTQVRYIEISK